MCMPFHQTHNLSRITAQRRNYTSCNNNNNSNNRIKIIHSLGRSFSLDAHKLHPYPKILLPVRSADWNKAIPEQSRILWWWRIATWDLHAWHSVILALLIRMPGNAGSVRIVTAGLIKLWWCYEARNLTPAARIQENNNAGNEMRRNLRHIQHRLTGMQLWNYKI